MRKQRTHHPPEGMGCSPQGHISTPEGWGGVRRRETVGGTVLIRQAGDGGSNGISNETV